jgi:DNA-binding response OmpR family regulator
VLNERQSSDSRVQEGNVLFVCCSGLERDLYVSALREAGFETNVEESPQAADGWLERAQALDVVVLDLLPVPEDAWALIARCCAHPSRIPVVVLTSLIRPDGLNRQRARTLGCAAFVAKPCSLRQLVDLVLRVQRGERNLEVLTYSGPGL